MASSQLIVSKAKRVIKCECSYFEFGDGFGMEKHFRKAHGIKPQFFVCLTCNVKQSYEPIAKHTKKSIYQMKCRVLPTPACHKCRVNGYGFLQELRKHVEVFHPDPSEFHCRSPCNLVFDSLKKLKTHWQMDHHFLGIFKCVLCKFGSSDASRLTIHLASHSTKKMNRLPEKIYYACGRCDAKFYTPVEIVGHAKDFHSYQESAIERQVSTSVLEVAEKKLFSTFQHGPEVHNSNLMVGRPTLVSSKPAASASTATARVHPASSSSSVNFGPSTAVGKPLASSMATTSKAPSLTEPSQANSETSGLKQFLQKILVQCSEGQIGFKMPFEIDNTADWHHAQKLQIYLSSAIDRYGVNMLKQNEPSTAEKSPPYPQGEQHQTPDNHSTRSLYRIAPEAPRPPQIFTGHSSGQSMITRETYVRPIHESRHGYGYDYDLRKPEEELEHRLSLSRPVTIPDLSRPPPLLLPKPTCSSWRSKPPVLHSQDKNYDEPHCKLPRLNRDEHF